MEKNEIIEGNKLIAEFMGGIWHPKSHLFSKWSECWTFGENAHRGFLESHLQYHTSWDWQIPAWSKICNIIRDYVNGGRDDDYDERNYYYTTMNRNYDNAVFQNDPMKGFGIIAEAIKWYDTNKQT